MSLVLTVGQSEHLPITETRNHEALVPVVAQSMTGTIKNHVATDPWPRLMSRSLAARYFGISPNHFERHVPIEPIQMGSRKLYDRLALDEYADAMSASQTEWIGECGSN